MDANAGRFTTDEAEIALRGLTKRLGVDEVVEIKGVRFRVVSVGNVDDRGEVLLRMLSQPDVALLKATQRAPHDGPPRNRHERRARAAERRRAKR